MTTNQTTTDKAIKRTFHGVVVSDKADKTIIVTIERSRMHSKYLKQFTVSRKFHVHDPKNQYHIGDAVTFIECRPLSRQKRWRVVYEPIAN